MDFDTTFAIGFLGIFGAALVVNQGYELYRAFWPPISGCVVRYLVLPKILNGQNIINPTRIELLCYAFQWVATIVYNTWGVTSLSHAASRAGTIAIIHIVPLFISHQLSFVSIMFGMSLSTVIKAHRALAIMAALQGILHSIVQLQVVPRRTESRVFQVLALSSLSALTVLPLFRRLYGYELFLYSHRAISITLFVGLWQHLRSEETLSRILLACALGGFFMSSIFQIVRQVYKNTRLNNPRGERLPRTLKAWRCCDNCDSSGLIVKIQLPWVWTVRPGQYIHLTLLTTKFASISQRHPFVIIWWEDDADVNDNKLGENGNIVKGQKHVYCKTEDQDTLYRARYIYVMIDPQQGWTRKAVDSISVFDDQSAWIDGPFGLPIALEGYGTVLLFASGSGIFAQLPLLKGLVDGLKSSAVKTRRVKLVWQTNRFHDQVGTWINGILTDDEIKEFLDVCIHSAGTPTAVQQINPWMTLVKDNPSVEQYVKNEIGRPEKSIAVTGRYSSYARDQQLTAGIEQCLGARNFVTPYEQKSYEQVDTTYGSLSSPINLDMMIRRGVAWLSNGCYGQNG